MEATKNHDSDETIPMEHDTTNKITEEEEEDYYEEEEEAMPEEEEIIPYENNPRRPSFQSCYACYSLSKAGKSDHLEHGDQIIMPESSLKSLNNIGLDFPILFEIRNYAKERLSHCGVSEFTAEDGTVLLPNWMMKNLQLEEGELVHLKSVKLEKGTYVKLQPHSVDFLGIVNPKAALEECLNNKIFCLTVGDTIKINYNNKDLFIDIVDAKPASAICILNTDCEVDFAPPLDYKEPVKPEVKQPPSTSVDEEVKALNYFVPFSGLARRLDGKSVENPVQLENTQAAKVQTMATESKKRKHPAAETLFGSSQSQAKISKKQKKADEIPQKKEFQPFSGKKYSLMG